MEGELRHSILEAMKAAMRSQAKERLGVIRLIQAAIKQREVDERIVLSDEQILAVLDKMVRERRESIRLFDSGGRPDLVDKESTEIQVLQEFLPQQLTRDEINHLIQQSIEEVGAQSVRDMSKVMSVLKPKVQGRADMGEVGGLIKNLLSQ